MRPRSLTLRLALLSAAWVALGLGVAGWLILSLTSSQMLRSFDGRLVNLLDAVAGVAAVGPEGQLSVGTVRALSATNFAQPLSGYYWQLAAPGARSATSRSLWDARLPPYDLAAGNGPHVRDVPGPRGERLRLAERAVVPVDGSQPVLVQVAIARGELDRDIRRLRLLVGGTFALLGAGLVLGTVALLVFGLAPLRRARHTLAEVRAGRRERLAAGPAPAEIAPLLEEIDALVAQNRATVDRARAHVGNLAHALKTPIAVQRAALAPEAPDLPLAQAQNAAMERLVQHHLVRARAAALAGSATTEAVPMAVAGEIARVLRRLFAGKGIEIALAGDESVRVPVDHQDLAEMLGNLLENACKWARSRVSLSVARENGGVMLRIADDGPGLPEAAREAVLARGIRLDEMAPGSGLGLAIVRDLAELYRGRLALDRAPEGGLLVRFWLPLR
ncbi:sensor histidine kinase [Siccirubricoccus sp. KC 17139]|uniref:histidine kinase n=1 Tax=Siccirubricoccus soli TaxID=2899147 RepID=A0ABT1D7I5_9PROT|nr:sensor histidine kinase [Siccirubricoccus soli]MCO6417220.1 sensor histidine kinase [Siccirubricoccus soli]MCP2683355.1 sensor histidine kinase [Siccirubricoccus soli]